MTHRGHYTTCKWCQNAREIQSEACQVLLPFVIICRLLQYISRSKNEFRIGFHVSTLSKLLRTLIPHFLVSNLIAVLFIQFWDSSDGDKGWSWRCRWHCRTGDKFPCQWNDSFFFVILLSMNSKLFSGSEEIGLRDKMKMMLHINVK